VRGIFSGRILQHSGSASDAGPGFDSHPLLAAQYGPEQLSRPVDPRVCHFITAILACHTDYRVKE